MPRGPLVFPAGKPAETASAAFGTARGADLEMLTSVVRCSEFSDSFRQTTLQGVVFKQGI